MTNIVQTIAEKLEILRKELHDAYAYHSLLERDLMDMEKECAALEQRQFKHRFN